MKFIIERMPEVCRATGSPSPESVYSAIRNGLFPPGISIGTRARGWPDYEIDAVNSARIAGKSDSEMREVVMLLLLNRKQLCIDIGARDD